MGLGMSMLEYPKDKKNINEPNINLKNYNYKGYPEHELKVPLIEK